MHRCPAPLGRAPVPAPVSAYPRAELTRRYARALTRHRDDRILDAEPGDDSFKKDA